MADLRQSLQLRQMQKLSPMQIQTIKLLNLNTLEIEQRIEEELEENPALEEDSKEDEISDEKEKKLSEAEDTKEDSYNDDDDDDGIPSYKLQTYNYSKDDDKSNYVQPAGENFQQHLIDQLGFKNLDEKQYEIGVFIIGSIDDDGYLRRSLESICDDIAFRMNVETTTAELEEVLKKIQEFEPAGVGARNLRECLLIQLKNKNANDKNIINACKIVDKYFESFTKKHYDKIKENLNIDDDELKAAIGEITALNPKPGNTFSDDYSEQGKVIVPDFILDVQDDTLNVQLNSYNSPELRVSGNYTQMMKDYAAKPNASRQDSEALKFLKQKVDSAKWFIDAIKQRQGTLLMVMNAIVEKQREYLITGDESKIRPMILKDVAVVVKIDISTVSRVINGKYIQTTFGILPLRHFFSEAMQNDSGETISTREIKLILQDCLQNEDKHKPLTDIELVNILKSKGYTVARRTVTKYRELMNFPVARLRREV